MKELLLRKLSSRKFWALLASLVVAVITLFNCDENTAVQVTSLLTTFGAVVAYILGEATVDKEKIKTESTKEDKGESEK